MTKATAATLELRRLASDCYTRTGDSGPHSVWQGPDGVQLRSADGARILALCADVATARAASLLIVVRTYAVGGVA